MAKPEIIAKWTEMSQTFLEDGPPKSKKHEACLFVNRCEVRKTVKGTKLIRQTGCEFIFGATSDEVTEKVRRFMLHDDLRLLAEGIDANDFDALPKEQKNPPAAIVDGTDDVYADKYAIGLPRK